VAPLETTFASRANLKGKEVLRDSYTGTPLVACPFVAIHCAALPEQLLESECGFDAAHHRRHFNPRPASLSWLPRRVVSLDESPDGACAQTKILRVYRTRISQRLWPAHSYERRMSSKCRGAIETCKVQVRAGAFREDLYYRVNVLTKIRIPPSARTPAKGTSAVRGQLSLQEFGTSTSPPAHQADANAEASSPIVARNVREPT